jgi:mannose-6-phosphate isomerase-like protein (cupin superfamily)
LVVRANRRKPTVTGVGISALINTVSRRYRIMDRARVRFVSLLFVEEEDVDHAGLNPEVAGLIVRPSDLRNAPAQALNVKAIRMGETGAELRRLVSPNSMPTSTLHAALITLHSREKMTPTKSLGVEVYYIISGSGVISKADEEIEFHLSPGDAIAIDPYT